MTSIPQIVHVRSEFFEETLEERIPSLVRRLTSELFNFTFYQVASIEQYKDLEAKPLIGFNRNYMLPQISDPGGELRGSVVIVGNQLVYIPNGIPLHHHRDSYLFEYAPDKFYTHSTFIDVVNGFMEDGFPMFLSEELLLKPEQTPDFSKLKRVSVEAFRRYD